MEYVAVRFFFFVRKLTIVEFQMAILFYNTRIIVFELSAVIIAEHVTVLFPAFDRLKNVYHVFSATDRR